MGVIALQAAVFGLFLPDTKGTATLGTMDDMKTQNEHRVAQIHQNMELAESEAF